MKSIDELFEGLILAQVQREGIYSLTADKIDYALQMAELMHQRVQARQEFENPITERPDVLKD